MVKNILHIGDASAYCDFGPEVNEQVNSRVISYFIKIKELQKKKKNKKKNKIKKKKKKKEGGLGFIKKRILNIKE